MNISPLAARWADWFGSSSRADAATSSTSAQATTTKSAGLDQTSLVADIVGDYDLRRITPREWNELVSRLDSSGQLDDQDRSDLLAVGRALEAAGYRPEERVDLLEFINRKLTDAQGQYAQAQESGDATQLATARHMADALVRQTEWLQRITMTQQA